MEKTHTPVHPEVESQAGNSMCVDIFKNRHSLDIIGIPYTYIWFPSQLASRNESFIWM